VNIFGVDGVRSSDPIFIAAAMNAKGVAQDFDGIALVEFLD
jgi:hypothetical protein